MLECGGRFFWPKSGSNGCAIVCQSTGSPRITHTDARLHAPVCSAAHKLHDSWLVFGVLLRSILKSSVALRTAEWAVIVVQYALSVCHSANAMCNRPTIGAHIRVAFHLDSFGFVPRILFDRTLCLCAHVCSSICHISQQCSVSDTTTELHTHKLEGAMRVIG